MTKAIFSIAFATLIAATAFADDHEIIEKVMKDGFKGKTSPIAKLVGGESTPEETKELAALVKQLHGTKAPKGEQDAYEKKVNELIAALDVVAGGDTSEAAIGRLKTAQNCKACHGDHKP